MTLNDEQLADAIRPMLMIGFPVHDDPILAGQELYEAGGWPGRTPNTHGRAPIEAFPSWFCYQFGWYILDAD